MNKRWVISMAAASVMARMAAASTTGFITNDTYIDNYFNTSLIDNAHTNYGHSGRVKAVTNITAPQSLVHGLFTLPDSFWSNVGTGTVTSMKIEIGIFNNQLNANAASPRQVEIHPLTHNFTAGIGGDGTGSTAGMLNTPTVAAGTDWFSSDGKYDANMNPLNPWATPGGGADYAATSTNQGSTVINAVTFFTWDISDFFTNPTLVADMKNNGLLLKVTSEDDYQGNIFASLYSSDYAAQKGSQFAPRFEYEFTPGAVPEPSIAAAMTPVLAALAGRRVRRSRA